MQKSKKATIAAAVLCGALFLPRWIGFSPASAYITAQNEDKAVASVSVGGMKIVVERKSEASNDALEPGGYADYAYTITKTGSIKADIYQVVTIKTMPDSDTVFSSGDEKCVSISSDGGEAFAPASSAQVLRDDGSLYSYYVIHTKADELPLNPSVKDENFHIDLARNAGNAFLNCTAECHVDVYAVEDNHMAPESKVEVEEDGTLKFYDDYSQFADGLQYAEKVMSGAAGS